MQCGLRTTGTLRPMARTVDPKGFVPGPVADSTIPSGTFGMHRFYVGLALCVMLSGCRTGRDYPAVDGPRYAGRPPGADCSRTPSDTLRIVTFNIEFALQVDSALAVLGAEPGLRSPDVLLLQEMDAASTRRIADSLGMWFVYYPAIFHERTRRDFGNAVLSRWPIIADAKIVLPHPSRYAGTHRIATAASLLIGLDTIRVYSTHLGTMADIRGSRRREQLRAILTDAGRYRRVILGGDLNEGDIGDIATQEGYLWPTEKGPRTTSVGRWDHIFLKGLAPRDAMSTGTVENVRGSSDHRPVWLVVVIDRAR